MVIAQHFLKMLNNLESHEGGLQFCRGGTDQEGVFRILLTGSWDKEHIGNFFVIAEFEIEGDIDEVIQIQNFLNRCLLRKHPASLGDE